jgi:hypothetical protein
MSRSSRAARSAISVTVNPRLPLWSAGCASGDRSSFSRVAGAVITDRPNQSPMRAASRGNRMRATSGTAASGPIRPVSTAPAAADRVPTWNPFDAAPIALRVRVCFRWAYSCPSPGSSATQYPGVRTIGHSGTK